MKVFSRCRHYLVAYFAAFTFLYCLSASTLAGPIYDWTGQCEVSYCNLGPAEGELTLADSYVPGTYSTDPDDFVSFAFTLFTPTYQPPPNDSQRVSAVYTHENLGTFNWVIYPNGSNALVECEGCPPGLPTSGNPVFNFAVSSETSGSWSIAPNYDGSLTSFTLRSQSVPEPASLALLGSGLLGLILARRRRRSYVGDLQRT